MKLKGVYTETEIHGGKDCFHVGQEDVLEINKFDDCVEVRYKNKVFLHIPNRAVQGLLYD